jgi:uncharacterized repeat protein (TIGR02543 family)
MASVIQEIVNRPGWSSGNALVVIITGSGERVAESHDGDPDGAPLLHVVYPEQYEVTVTVAGNGTVSNTPGNPYTYDQTATLEPLADPGWTFAGWSGPDAAELSDNSDGTWSLTMDGDKSLTATFSQDEYDVTVTVVGNGTVNHTPGNPYTYAQTATLEALADPDWTFAGWSGPDAVELSDNGDGTWDLTMDSDKAVSATFTPEQCTLTSGWRRVQTMRKREPQVA